MSNEQGWLKCLFHCWYVTESYTLAGALSRVPTVACFPPPHSPFLQAILTEACLPLPWSVPPISPLSKADISVFFEEHAWLVIPSGETRLFYFSILSEP